MTPKVLEKSEKNCRMDLRLTRAQRTKYERAASLRGETLSQWSTSHLDECANRDIAEASTTWLSADSFEQFCSMLETEIPLETQELLARKPIWQ